MLTDTGQMLLSIAIPTKNRQIYLINLVDELLRSPRWDFEIVIQDNSDDDQLAAYVAGLNDTRVRYTYFGEWISVVDNCDAAIRACSGHYVCMLGDDDGLMLEESLEMLETARADGIDAVMSEVLLYTWPDLQHHTITNLGAKLYLKPLANFSRVPNVQSRARRVVRRSGAMGIEGLPCVYQGFASRALLSRLDDLSGSHFPGPSPDMANAIGLSALSPVTRFVRQPLVIAGHSRKSGAGQGTMREHRGAIAAQRHLPADTAEKWYPEIPFFWSGATIYAQSVGSAVERTRAVALGKPRYACLYAACLIFEPDFAGETWRAMRQSRGSLLAMLPAMAFYAVLIAWKRAVQYKHNLLVRFAPDKAASRADSIADAIHLIRETGIRGSAR